MRAIPERSDRLTKDPAYSAAVGGYESQPPRPPATSPCKKAGSLWETRNKQQLMSDLVAPDMETYLVSTQKSAEGIVVVNYEGPNVEMSGAANELGVGIESDRMSRHRRVMESLSLDPFSVRIVLLIVDSD